MSQTLSDNHRIAVISDIHANLHALRSVIQHARQQNVDEIWNAGDSIGYGAFPDEVMDFIIAEQVLSIQGNYDTKVLKVPKKKNSWGSSKNPIKWQAMYWAYQNLKKKNRKILAGFPVDIKLNRLGWKIILLHGSPATNEEPLLAETPEDRLRELAGMVEENVIICGHSHQAFFRKVGDKYFLNPGSVGRQDDGDPRASYTILDLHVDSLQVSVHRIAYDYEEAAQAIRINGLPEQFAQMLLSGSGFQNL
jgi:putative phosphoesterase